MDQTAASSLKESVCNLKMDPQSENGAQNLTEETINSIIASNEVVLIMFYLNWADKRVNYVAELDETARLVKVEFPRKGQIVIGKIEGEAEPSLVARFDIWHYSQFKLIRNGEVLKRTYQGRIKKEQMLEFIRKELEDPIKEFQDVNDFGTVDPLKRIYIGYFESKDSTEYDIFRQAASKYKHFCEFRAKFGDNEVMHPLGKPVIVLRPDAAISDEKNEIFNGPLDSYDELNKWMFSNYVPLVRREEITFANRDFYHGEELPLLTLLYNSEDDQIVTRYTNTCESLFMHFKNKILFLTSADQRYISYYSRKHNYKYALPVIIFENLDFFKYFFTNIEDMETSGKLEEFVNNLIPKTPNDSEEAPNLTKETIESTIQSNEIVFVMFYEIGAESFEDIPMFNNAAKNIKEEFPQTGQVLLAKIECCRKNKGTIGNRFSVRTFPTFLIIRNRRRLKKEFRGAKTVKALVDYVKQEWAEWKYIKEFPDKDDFGPLDPLI